MLARAAATFVSPVTSDPVVPMTGLMDIKNLAREIRRIEQGDSLSVEVEGGFVHIKSLLTGVLAIDSEGRRMLVSDQLLLQAGFTDGAAEKSSGTSGIERDSFDSPDGHTSYCESCEMEKREGFSLPAVSHDCGKDKKDKGKGKDKDKDKGKGKGKIVVSTTSKKTVLGKIS